MNSLSPPTNCPRQQSGAFAAFHLSQKLVFLRGDRPLHLVVPLGRVGTLLGLPLAAWHNLGRWEAIRKLSQNIGQFSSSSGWPAPRWRCCNALSTCDHTLPCPLRD